MPRVTHVKKARQRYATKPVIDPATGQQKVTPVMKRNGEQKVTKRGKPVVLRVTERDLSKPLPMPTCDYPSCGKPIEVGTPYKHITPKSGPFGGRTRYRHAAHPSWQPWEYSNSLGARIAQVQHAFGEAFAAANDADDVTAALSEAADELRALADEKREGASNIEDGFGHPTYQSEELEQLADDLEAWADDVEAVVVPDPNDYPCEECNDGEATCDDCGGSGVGEADDDDEAEPQCETCEGSGVVDCEACDDDHLDPDAWREAVESEVGIVDEQPF